MKKALALLLAALMALTLFAACGSKNDSKKGDGIVGTWTLDFESMMSELSEEERAMMEAFGVTADQFTMEYTFNEDGTGKVTGNMMGETMEEEFTYTAKDGRLEITATVDGETNTTGANYEIKDDTLTITEEDESMTFKRK